MYEITFLTVELVFAGIWLLLRIIVWVRQGQFSQGEGSRPLAISWRREAVLMLMFINLAVIIRFVFFPRDLVDGRVQPLVFNAAAIRPLWVNFVPLVHLFDYDSVRDIVWNVAGNAAMFVPSGIILPIVYRQLDNAGKVIGAGALISLCTEILQLPFAARASDVDDLILNTLGVAAGYAIYALVRRITRRPRQ